MNRSRQRILGTQADCGGGSLWVRRGNDDDAWGQSFDGPGTGIQQMAQGWFGDIVQGQENGIRSSRRVLPLH
jgi:hypothetical protein